MDPNNCFLDIQAGSGGTEAQDWASMLERMYLRYGERREFKSNCSRNRPGEVAGIKSAALKIVRRLCVRHLRTETGMHRLVRKSPFDSNARRHTSFASVFVYPEVDEPSKSTVNPADLRVDRLPCDRRWRSARQQDRIGVRITHFRAHRRAVSERSLATSQPRRSDGDAEGEAI